jgi:hypothetical protein
MKDFKIYKNIAFLLGIITTVLIMFTVTGCKKNNPAPYVPPTSVDTTNWQNQYTNGGTLPNWTSGTQTNDLVGTTWLLTKIMNGFGTTIMYDTLHFVTNIKYYIGSDTTNSASYTLYSAQNNMTLTFKPLMPVNYMHCSTDQLGLGFASGSQIIGVEFVNLYDTSTKFKAWFTKL